MIVCTRQTACNKLVTVGKVTELRDCVASDEVKEWTIMCVVNRAFLDLLNEA